MPWWGIVGIALGSAALAAIITYLGVMIYIGKGMWQ
jgi:hypothetical protein